LRCRPSADVTVHHALLGEQVLEMLPRGAHVLIMTHDHAEDFALCDMALRLPGLRSVGLIGSSSKWTGFRRRLAEAGHEQEVIDRIRCPSGLPEITGKSPPVIAIGVASELVLRMQEHTQSVAAVR
jgi:xanthine dehydrogenase accessory factor